MKSIIVIFVSLLLLTNCEQIIDLEVNKNLSKVVIEGNITNEAGPYFVKITRSIPLKDQSSKPTIDNAEVTISDNEGHTETLTPVGSGIYQTTRLVGKVGNTYNLSVKIGTETYNAESTMPDIVQMDSIRVVPNSFGGEIEYDFVPIFKDPVTKGDIYRFLLWIDGKLLKSHFILNDQLENGVVNGQHLQNITDLLINPGAIIKIQMQKVDSRVGLYYTTLVLNTDTGPGGGTTPNNPPNNISNGALGIFSAHTVQEKSTLIR